MSGISRRLLLIAALALPAAIVTCKSSEAPKVPTTIVVTPSPVTLATVGHSQQLTAVVKDQSGTVMTGQKVTWASNALAVATVDTTGKVTAVANGTATVTAASGSASQPVTVTVAQVGALIAKSAGDAQTGTVGQALGSPLVAQVNDSAGHAAAGVTVTFAVVGGAGSVGSATAVTNSSGQAQTTWTLGQTAGSQSLTASVSGAPSPATFTATANAGAAKSIAIQAGDNQTTATGTAVAVAPAVIVKDTFNNAKSGVTVNFTTTAGNGSVTGGVALTNASGIATVGGWILGNVGTDTLTATATGTGISGNPVKFLATSAAAGAPANVVAYVGNNKIGLVGWGVNVRPAVRVTDASNLPVNNATVTFAATGGGGSGTGLVATTNVNGIAQVGSWVLGGSAGTNTMTATVTGAGITGNPVTFSDTGYAAGYTITLINYGATPPAAAQAAFDSAQAKWQRLIYRPLTSVSVTDAGNACGAKEPAISQVTTGLIIAWAVDSIDGAGKILAQAGPCLIRSSNSLTALGIMKFDSADIGSLISNGTLNSVILHEMGHVIGFGTLWSQSPNAWLQLPSTPPGTINDTYFNGPKGLAAFDSLGGTSYTGGGSSPPAGNKVPVENCGTNPYVSPLCGTGTVNGHWREVVLGNELMTGFVQSTGGNPLSFLSVAAQEDLGYVVNYSAADTYVHTFTAPAVGGVAPLFLGDDIRHGPIYVIDSGGHVVRVIQRQ